MNITIRQLDTSSLHQVDTFERNSTVNSHLVLHVEENQLRYTIIPVKPYEKILSMDAEDYTDYVDNPDKVVFFAVVEGEPVGQIRIVSWWNKFAFIQELTVNKNFRGKGVGHALLQRGIQWAREQDFPGIMLETQDNNVPACKLYEKCGFVLGGFDRYAYKNFPESRHEIALYWYLIF